MNESVLAQKFISLLERFEGRTFSYNMSMHLVGGKKRLEHLINEGKLRYDKKGDSRNSPWEFNAIDILKNVKPNLKYERLAVKYS